MGCPSGLSGAVLRWDDPHYPRRRRRYGHCRPARRSAEVWHGQYVPASSVRFAHGGGRCADRLAWAAIAGATPPGGSTKTTTRTGSNDASWTATGITTCREAHVWYALARPLQWTKRHNFALAIADLDVQTNRSREQNGATQKVSPAHPRHADHPSCVPYLSRRPSRRRQRHRPALHQDAERSALAKDLCGTSKATCHDGSVVAGCRLAWISCTSVSGGTAARFGRRRAVACWGRYGCLRAGAAATR